VGTSTSQHNDCIVEFDKLSYVPSLSNKTMTLGRIPREVSTQHARPTNNTHQRFSGFLTASTASVLWSSPWSSACRVQSCSVDSGDSFSTDLVALLPTAELCQRLLFNDRILSATSWCSECVYNPKITCFCSARTASESTLKSHLESAVIQLCLQRSFQVVSEPLSSGTSYEVVAARQRTAFVIEKKTHSQTRLLKAKNLGCVNLIHFS